MSHPFQRFRAARSVTVALCVAAHVFGTSGVMSASPGADRFAGQWTGTYGGDDSGTVTVSLTIDADGRYKGGLSATRDQGGSFESVFKSLTVDADRLVAKYDWSEGGEVTLEGTFDGNEVAGTWLFEDLSGNTSGGTWKASRQVTQE